GGAAAPTPPARGAGARDRRGRSTRRRGLRGWRGPWCFRGDGRRTRRTPRPRDPPRAGGRRRGGRSSPGRGSTPDEVGDPLAQAELLHEVILQEFLAQQAAEAL